MGNIIIKNESGKVIYYGRHMFDFVDSLTDMDLNAQQTEWLLFICAAIHDAHYHAASIHLSAFLGYKVDVSVGFISDQPEVNELI